MSACCDHYTSYFTKKQEEFRKKSTKGVLCVAREKAGDHGADCRGRGAGAVAVRGGSASAAAAAFHRACRGGAGKKAGRRFAEEKRASARALLVRVRAGALRSVRRRRIFAVPAFVPSGRRVPAPAAGAGWAARRTGEGAADAAVCHRGQIPGRRRLRASRGADELF